MGETEGITIHDGPAAELLEGQSILQRAASRRRDRDLGGGWHDIPSWGGELQAYYVVLEKEDVEEMVRRARARAQQRGRRGGDASGRKKVSEGASDADLDFIIKACRNFRAVDSITGDEEELNLTYKDIDGWKAQLLVEDPEADEEREANQRLESVQHPREMCAYLMGYQSIPIAAHAGRLANWMQDTSKEDPT